MVPAGGGSGRTSGAWIDKKLYWGAAQSRHPLKVLVGPHGWQEWAPSKRLDQRKTVLGGAQSRHPWEATIWLPWVVGVGTPCSLRLLTLLPQPLQLPPLTSTHLPYASCQGMAKRRGICCMPFGCFYDGLGRTHIARSSAACGADQVDAPMTHLGAHHVCSTPSTLVGVR